MWDRAIFNPELELLKFLLENVTLVFQWTYGLWKGNLFLEVGHLCILGYLYAVVVRQSDHGVLDTTKLHRLFVGKIVLHEHTCLWALLASLKTQLNSINPTCKGLDRCHTIGHCEVSNSTASDQVLTVAFCNCLYTLAVQLIREIFHFDVSFIRPG
jgi:hypothetical protein